jgi:uncharacterized protein YbaA (DUF1428 family)
MSYVDGFVIPIKKSNLKAYRAMAKKAEKIWRELGCVDYKECAGDDLKSSWGVTFTKLAKAKPSETVVFSYIVYRNRKHRDQVNQKVMKDPRIAAMMRGKPPFDVKRMAYGGFATMVGD